MTVVLTIAMLIMIYYMVQEHRRMDDLVAQPGSLVSYKMRDFEEYRDNTDARIIELEAQVATLRRALLASGITVPVPLPTQVLRAYDRDGEGPDNPWVATTSNLPGTRTELERQFAFFANEYDLSPAQREQILPELERERRQIYDLLHIGRGGKMSRSELLARLQTMRAGTDSRVRPLLETDAQREAYQRARVLDLDAEEDPLPDEESKALADTP